MNHRSTFKKLLTGVVLMTLLSSSSLMATPATAQLSEQIDPALTNYYFQNLQWNNCDSDSCTRVAVPLDYRDPSGSSISIAIRVMGSRELPSLITNPGGPGSGGMNFARYLAGAIDPDVRKQYSIVGFDPRGTGDSSPITCLSGKSANVWLRSDATPDNQKEIATLMRQARRISQGCSNFSRPLASNMGTDETVRDIDIIRKVLNNDTLHWLGYSYGTTLGTRYAELFPDNVGRMVLDGAVDPSLDAMQLSRDQSIGFQRAVKRFNTQYPGSIDYMNNLLKTLDHTPMATGSSQTLVQSEAMTAIFYSMYSPSLWPRLNRALRESRTGDGTSLQLISYEANNQTSPTQFSSNLLSAFYAINCWDYPPTPTASGLKKAARAWSTNSSVPELARAMSWGNAPCSSWFGHSTFAPAAARTTTQAPILIIGTTFDPATPYRWSKALHRQLPTSSLLTYFGDGHTAYLSGSKCVDRHVNTFLITGVKAANKTCP
jgi:pimeloyl-ACP methyl ester carboxylesterase